MALGCASGVVSSHLNSPATGGDRVRVTVSEVWVSRELILTSQQSSLLSGHEQIGAQLRLRNDGSQPQRIDLDRIRLMVTGAGGQQVGAVPVAELSAVGVVDVSRLGPLASRAVVVAPAEEQIVSLVFAGLGGMSTASPFDLRLTGIDGVEPIILASPTLAAPRWQSNLPRLSASWSFPIESTTGPGFQVTGVGSFEAMFGSGRFVFGIVAPAAAFVTDTRVLRMYRHRHSIGMGLRLGWLPYEFPLGLIGGIGFALTDSADQSAETTIDQNSMAFGSLALRFRILRPPRNTPLVPVELPRNPFAAYYIEAGYVRWLKGGGLPTGNGFLFKLGIALSLP